MQDKFKTICSNKTKEDISLQTFIDEKHLLKTKVKLLHIMHLDHDLKLLEAHNQTLSSLSLNDLFLTPRTTLISPVKNKIIPLTKNNLKLSSYLIYLSYLYNFDFTRMYEQDAKYALSLIANLAISYHLKSNVLVLAKCDDTPYFSTYLEELNTSFYRENQRKDRLILQRSVK